MKVNRVSPLWVSARGGGEDLLVGREERRLGVDHYPGRPDHDLLRLEAPDLGS
jgi:hypothetical protein